MFRLAAALALLATPLIACEASDPSVPDPGSDGFTPGGSAGDVVLAFTDASDTVQTCTDTLPACGDPLPNCGPVEVLGASDGATFTIPAGGRLDIGFRCAAILELGSPGGDQISFDFSLSATVPDGSDAIVEVSFDGTLYQSLPNRLSAGSQSFDLATLELDVVRFVRIIDSGSGGIAIDSVQALSL